MAKTARHIVIAFDAFVLMIANHIILTARIIIAMTLTTITGFLLGTIVLDGLYQRNLFICITTSYYTPVRLG